MVFKKKRAGFYQNPTLDDISTVFIKMHLRCTFTFEFNWQRPISQVKTKFHCAAMRKQEDVKPYREWGSTSFLFFSFTFYVNTHEGQFDSTADTIFPYQRFSVLPAAKVNTSIQTETFQQDGAAFESRIR